MEKQNKKYAGYGNVPAVKNRVGRPTKEVVLQRTREVAAMLLNSKSRSEIIKYCCDEYGVQETTVNNIVKKAYQYIAETHQHDKEGLVMSHVEKYYDIFRAAKDLGDNRGAIMALNSIEKLLKLVLPETAIQQNTFNLDVSKLSIEQLKELLKKED